ncbi:MAG: hypothetical protein ACT6QM_05945 [Brevundimonas mediterranea]|uniref:hypothetical protein n=1 Tax=Brevundimonas mediterranea TaxID=74329 RepID=UPI004034E2B2
MIVTHHLNLTLYVESDHLLAFRERVENHPSIAVVRERLDLGISGVGTRFTQVELLADDTIEAAIFLASISADKERAAMFKMFWSGE